MVSDTVYELCLPVLEEPNLEDEAKIERLENLLSEKSSLKGSQLENAVLDSLWRFREKATASPIPTPVRHTVVRRHSPAPWQLPRSNTPSLSSPSITASSIPPGFGAIPPAFRRANSSTGSPFTSPRSSPRLAYSTPQIPHSPSLQSYEFPAETTSTSDAYGDLGSDNVDWLVSEDGLGGTPSPLGYSGNESSLNGAAASYIRPHQVDMSPYDILRSVVGEGRSDEDIENALQSNSFDVSATINSLMDTHGWDKPAAHNAMGEQDGSILIGRSMNAHHARPMTPSGQQRSGIVCKYWLSTGSCLRADCRFSHDLSNHICKYWLVGNCLAGDTCIFSHDPSNLVQRLAVEENSLSSSRPLQMQDYSSFPALNPMDSASWNASTNQSQSDLQGGSIVTSPPGSRVRSSQHGDFDDQVLYPRPNSGRPSRQSTPSVPAVDDTEAFPSLGDIGTKFNKKSGTRRALQGKISRDSLQSGPNSLADVVRMSPSPAANVTRKGLKQNKSFTGTRENSAAAQAIPAPQHIPWLETGDRANKAYLKARQEAIKHGGLRNKFLQSAAQAWNRNDSRAAKALSLRGQSENDLMRTAHREAASQLYGERNETPSTAQEVFIDLHGLHPEEAVEYLERVLLEQQYSKSPVYAITGTGHHSRNGKDKVGKAIRGFLNEWRYAYREFSAPGDRNSVGGILGIDPGSFDKKLSSSGNSQVTQDIGPHDDENDDEVGTESPIPVRVTLVREPPRGLGKTGIERE